jgi:hypothetical protein
VLNFINLITELTFSPKNVRLDTINVAQYRNAVCLKITLSWDVTLCGLVYGYKCYRRPACLCLQDSPRRLPRTCITSLTGVKIEEADGSFYLSTWHNIPEDLSLKQC